MGSARTAVVTGGTGALGRAVVETLLRDGWTVHVPWRNREGATALRARLAAAEGRLHLAEADAAKAADVARFFESVERRSGRLHALCNLAGGFMMEPVEKASPDAWQRMFTVNATTAFLCCRAAIPLMKAGGGGRIVTVASAAAFTAPPRMAAYAAAKAAVVALTRSLAAEVAGDGITVNAIAPTTLDTAANREAMPDADPSGWVSLSEAAEAVRWLVGEEAGAVSGSVLRMGR